MKSWYLLYCKPRGETRAQDNLKLQQIETYLPMHAQQVTKAGKTSVKRSPLFPCYLFIHFDPEQTSVSRIHSTRGVSRIVGCKEQMTPIDDSIIHSIRMQEHKLLNNFQLSDFEPSQAVQPKLAQGDKVVFVDGPFAELEGIFAEQSGEKRCHILFEIMGQQKRVTVDKASIKLKDS
ncbi:transcription/translation regulatory transformer protein RfaH [Shewanella sp. Isolate11]|uniref:transcription/translation regulatory transformer protein RfaH n=1 Tax=Shewanella sp. Isolate11 TaxID=2908530 RepID=UPI001EFD19EA|nr:transcription/translation regulatory transformer protein RfaH [Shewanella sp. Isolate11]MCG9697120.1 transcription/translation regulatory transformer protein RfaH [Shewanella sp. Isolate11]